MMGWVPSDWLKGRYYTRRDSELCFELRERLMAKLVLAVYLPVIFIAAAMITAAVGPSWVATLLLFCAFVGSLFAFLPGYVIADGTRRELRVRTGLRKFALRPRTISFDDIEKIIVWHSQGVRTGDRLSIWLDLRNAGSIKIDSTMDDEYTNDLASALSERIGVEVAVRDSLFD